MKYLSIALVIVSQIASPAMAGGCFKKRFFSGHRVIHQKVIEQVCVPQVQQFHYFGAPSPLPEFQAQLAVGTLERQLQRVQDQFAALQQYQAQYAGYQQQATVQYAQPAPVQYAQPQVQYQQQPPQTYAYQPPPQQPQVQYEQRQYYAQAQPAPQYQPPAYAEQPPAQYQEQPQPYYPPQQQAAPQSCPTCPQPQQQAYPAEQYPQYPPQQQHGYGQPAPQQHGYPQQQQQPYQPLPHEQGYPQQAPQQLPPQEGYAQQQPHATVLGSRCLECHTGPESKGGVDFNQPLEFEEKKEVFNAARNGKMPKGGVKLTPQELGRMFVELFTPAEQQALQRQTSGVAQ